ncbi:alpha/beta hydrolase [Pyruvatibacter mobilis]|uniref:alpha/beta hydrolase n=1 Tax=Pyruvatibacter mobilis TaxID=1712261 RepID=UPI003BAC7507
MLAINFSDTAELDRQYDIAAAIPEIGAVAHEMKARSAHIRANCPGYQEHAYGKGPLQNLDYFPAGPDRPLLVYIHGGYWYAFDKEYFSEIGRAWNRVGVSVAIVNYRLAPTVRMGEIVDDVRQSVAWLWRNSNKLGFDRSQIVVSGSSAGGHLTAMMLATDWVALGPDLPAHLLKGGASISGLHDLEPFLRAPFLKDTLRLSEDDVRRYSPARLKPASSAPLITCVGGDESPAFHAQNALIAEIWPGVFKQDIPSPGTNHVTVNMELMNAETRLFKAIEGLFGQ